ncbi:hypothetical protein BJX65DRAFT_5071 [Aspergillus insuetus]
MHSGPLRTYALDTTQDHPARVEEAKVYRTLWHHHHDSEFRKVTKSTPMTLTRVGPAPRGRETWSWPQGSMDSLKKYKNLVSSNSQLDP